MTKAIKGVFTISIFFLVGTMVVFSQWNTNGAKIYYNNGNVGIGTISPNEKFQVVAGLNMKMSLNTFTVGSGSSEPALYLSRWVGSGNLYQSHVLHTLKGGDNKYGLAFSTSGSAHDYDDKSGISTKMYLSQSGKRATSSISPRPKWWRKMGLNWDR